MPGLLPRGSPPSCSSSGGIWSRQRDAITNDQLQKKRTERETLDEQPAENGFLAESSNQDENLDQNDALDGSHDEQGSSGKEDDEGDHGAAEESDSSEDEVAPRNTDFEMFPWSAGVDDSKSWRKIYDKYNDEEVELTKEEMGLLSRILKGKTPHAEVDPCADYVDWFVWEDNGHPLSNAPEPKRRSFLQSGNIRRFFNMLEQFARAGLKNKRHGLSYIPAPKPKLPGHEESYSPSVEYIPSQEEINSYQLMYEEDRPKFIPRRFESLRSVPAYENALKEGFDRCLDLYLCPRTPKEKLGLNIDPETLKPKLPNRKDLKPYPTTCYLEYRGHTGPVKSISIEISGQWIASGSTDGTVRIWEIDTGRCLKVWNVGEAVQHVAWNPLPELPILAISLGRDVLLLNTGLGNEEEQLKVKELLHVEEPVITDDACDNVIVPGKQGGQDVLV
ncbi:hypothetical protein J5N97_001754 [Dioscorea zingiberensis]|uniref:BOP1 N-terminal domain-containing protein n=1 Tax=Dioscorea zingiberensis TaxID=325984 RepID=A0A9D5BT94_9LILI|nr:hypothetical protein J5N97_001754 [Dioscorea zingiberensis]